MNRDTEKVRKRIKKGKQNLIVIKEIREKVIGTERQIQRETEKQREREGDRQTDRRRGERERKKR